MSAKHKDIIALRDAALEDLLGASDNDLRLEAQEAGVDLDRLAKEMKLTMREAASKALRQRMQVAKTRVLPASQVIKIAQRPNLEKIKEVIQSLFTQDPSIGLAFRDGKRQSDSDWQTLYDDLIALGAIKGTDDEP